MKSYLRAKYVVIVLILLDVTFIQLHRLFLHKAWSIRFSLENESGYAEYYQHFKELAVALIALTLLIKRADPLYLCWTLLFSYLFLDDSFEFHENLGLLLSDSLNLTSAYGLRGRDYGELLVFVGIGLSFSALLGICYWRRKAKARKESMFLLAMLLALSVFGVLVDMAHIKVASDPWNYRLGMVEDGGEMLVISIMLGYLLANLQKYDG